MKDTAENLKSGLSSSQSQIAYAICASSSYFFAAKQIKRNLRIQYINISYWAKLQSLKSYNALEILFE